MTPHLRAAARPDVAAAITGRLLRHAARDLPETSGPGRDTPRYTVDWAGPVGADLPDERAVQAACGLMQVHGRATGGPLPLAVDYASVVAGVLAAQGATALRVARARGLDLREVRTSVAQGALLAVGQYLAAETARDNSHPPEPDSPAPSAAGPDALPTGGLATLETSDGARVEVETLDPLAWREFWARLGVAPALAGRGWLPFQQRFATAVCPLPDELRRAARRHTPAELRAAAHHTGVSLLTVGSDPAPAVRPAAWCLTPGPAPFPRARAHPDTAVPGPRPAVPLSGAVLPLTGVRVVESTRRVQGPLAGHVLRMLGAEVVRIEPPGSDPMRWLPPLAGDCSARFSALNAGKPVVEADLTTAPGRETVRALAAEADVFLHNWAPGKAARLGLDASDLLPGRPALVYAWASGFGHAFGDRPPPLGTDYLAQVHSGLAAAVRPADQPPAPSLMTLTDVLGGLVCAQGMLAALAAREATGRGSRVDSSLVSAAALVPRPAHRPRWTALDRPLRTADGHLYLGPEARACPEAVLRVVDGVGPMAAEYLAARFARRTTQEWTARLAEAGLTATPVLTDLTALARDPAFRAAVAPPDPSTGHARPYAPWEFA
ncbi:Crotonobetainyl-CoA:carnitine CoA-transferase CaiB [Streptomyces sp. Ag82_O1-12]|uniref:CoA transferase n=1 Tax=unclassified Streptomyces TaxID=2593676 RepID=UPI000BCEC0DD|nr:MULTISPECIES: CoA transferase [unclassified Streptomyces]SMQ19509.1 Crotonobetainyl-CoA:carnitine CoA-transferase CaiB [Streptomyces sp. Ag82_O1-12]SOD48550.1 Crotonobetainyl-CoA:carnitine CoA-transferase CaiB [Streptomyces sp. Ag82_G6-1]